MNYQCRRWLWE